MRCNSHAQMDTVTVDQTEDVQKSWRKGKQLQACTLRGTVRDKFHKLDLASGLLSCRSRFLSGPLTRIALFLSTYGVFNLMHNQDQISNLHLWF
jgi:hypothetical protein